VSLDEAAVLSPGRAEELIALDDALKSLAIIDVRRSHVVELRFFGGLSNEEIAEVLKISPNTVMRDWKVPKAWLYRAMSRSRRMNPERWQQASRILEIALERSPERRAAYLDEVCANDDELRREVESLLLASAQAGRKWSVSLV